MVEREYFNADNHDAETTEQEMLQQSNRGDDAGTIEEIANAGS